MWIGQTATLHSNCHIKSKVYPSRLLGAGRSTSSNRPSACKEWPRNRGGTSNAPHNCGSYSLVARSFDRAEIYHPVLAGINYVPGAVTAYRDAGGVGGRRGRLS